MISSGNFGLFDPRTSQGNDLPDAPGVYFVVLRPAANLLIKMKNVEVPQMTAFSFNGEYYKVIYVGESGKSLRSRDFVQHFKGTAGKSTLRKSLGCLLGYNLIPRDANALQNGKTTFKDEDESALTEWMSNNLLLIYCATEDFTTQENKLIKEYNLPLNLKGNFNKVNSDFRKRLSYMRKYSAALSTPSRPDFNGRLSMDNVPIYSYCPVCGEVLWDNQPYCFICGWKA